MMLQAKYKELTKWFYNSSKSQYQFTFSKSFINSKYFRKNKRHFFPVYNSIKKNIFEKNNIQNH